MVQLCMYSYFQNFTFLGGKRDENLILPLNDSLSATLSTEDVSEH